MQDQSIQPVQSATKSKKQLVWGLVCLFGPTVLIVVSILLYSIINLIFGATATSDGDLFGDSSPAKTILNVILFIIGAFSVATWLPGIIGGIVLLATRKK